MRRARVASMAATATFAPSRARAPALGAASPRLRDRLVGDARRPVGVVPRGGGRAFAPIRRGFAASARASRDARNTYLLTAYELDAPPVIEVATLRLVAKRRGADADLWRRVRLAREVRVGTATPGEGDELELFVPAPANWGPHPSAPNTAVLRAGAAGPVTAALRAALGPDVELVEDPPTILPPPTTRAADPADGSRPDADYFDAVADARLALIRECLYARLTAVAGDAYEVSRDGARGVLLAETPPRKKAPSSSSGAPDVPGTRRVFRLTAEERPARDADDGSHLESSAETLATRIVFAASREPLPPARTVRDLVDAALAEDDPSRALARLDGAPVRAVGGPRLDGRLRVCLLDGDASGDGVEPTAAGRRTPLPPVGDPGTVGEARSELGGDSLLAYHRKRYPARIPLLDAADPDARAVWLETGNVFGGATKRSDNESHPKNNNNTRMMAFPAELLVPKGGGTLLGGSPSSQPLSSSGGPSSSVGDDAATTRVATSLARDLLGPAFAVFGSGVSRKMLRLPSPPETASSGPCGKLVGAGGVASGPAVVPGGVSLGGGGGGAGTTTKKNKAAAGLFLPSSTRVLAYLAHRPGADPGEARRRVAAGVGAALESWGVERAFADAVLADIAEARAFAWDPAGADAVGSMRERLERIRVDAVDSLESAPTVVLVDAGGGWTDETVRRAARAARVARPRRRGPRRVGRSAERTDSASSSASSSSGGDLDLDLDSDWRALAAELCAARGAQATTFPAFAGDGRGGSGAAGGSVPGVAFGHGGVAFVGVGAPGARVVAVVDENAAVVSSAGGAAEIEEEPENPGEKERDDPNASRRQSRSDRFWTSAAERAVGAALAAWSGTSSSERASNDPSNDPSNGLVPARLVVHHEGESGRAFARAVARLASARGVASVDVVDVVSDATTGRVLRWNPDAGVRRAERGLFWVLGPDDALAQTSGPRLAADDDEQEEDRMPATRPLRLRRRAGRSRAYDLAREVVVLAAAETRGFEGGHAAPLTLRGRNREGIAVLLL